MDKNLCDLISKYEKEFPEGSPLLNACHSGRIDDVKLFIKCDKSRSVNEPQNYNDSFESTPLMAAAWKEHFQVVQYLIEECEADPNIALSDGCNPLHLAAQNNKKKKLIKFLLTNMSFNSINKKTKDGATPLDYVYLFNRSPIRQEIIDLIREYGGRRAEELRREEIKRNVEEARTEQYLDLISKYRKEFPEGYPSAPLLIACELGRFDHVKILITYDKSISVNELQNYNEVSKSTPLIVATWNEQFQVVQYLIEECEADPNIADSDGWNALHYAAQNNKKDTELIELLLTNMPLNSINKKNRSGDTPLDRAYEYNYSPLQQEIIDLIRKYSGRRAEELDTPPLPGPLKEEPEVRISKYNKLRAEEVTQTKEELLARYEKEFPNATPFICACERGQLQDVKEFHYYDIGVEEGYDSKDYQITAINIVIKHGHMGLFKYLIENFKRIPFFNTYDGWTMLHYGALYLQYLKEFKYVATFSNVISLDDGHVINLVNVSKETALDLAYQNKYIQPKEKKKLITYIRSIGGKANWYDSSGKKVGKGKGDLNEVYLREQAKEKKRIEEEIRVKKFAEEEIRAKKIAEQEAKRKEERDEKNVAETMQTLRAVSFIENSVKLVGKPKHRSRKKQSTVQTVITKSIKTSKNPRKVNERAGKKSPVSSIKQKYNKEKKKKKREEKTTYIQPDLSVLKVSPCYEKAGRRAKERRLLELENLKRLTEKKPTDIKIISKDALIDYDFHEHTKKEMLEGLYFKHNLQEGILIMTGDKVLKYLLLGLSKNWGNLTKQRQLKFKEAIEGKYGQKHFRVQEVMFGNEIRYDLLFISLK
jgi:ankyrin repeat protein